jgi:hypothetical protein
VPDRCDGIGEHAPHPGACRELDDALGVRRHHQLVHEIVLHDPLDHPGDERLAGQKLERFVGETGRAKTCRYDTEDAHHGN